MKCTFLFFVVLVLLSVSEVFAQTVVRDSARVKFFQDRYLPAVDGDVNKAKQIAIIQVASQDSARLILKRNDIDKQTKRTLMYKLDSIRQVQLRSITGDDRLLRGWDKGKDVTR